MAATRSACPVSAHSGEGLDTLKESLLLQADLLDLKANPSRAARGVVLESRIDKGMGSAATLSGTGRHDEKGRCFLSWGQNGGAHGALRDEEGGEISEALPSTPVLVTGLHGLPQAGDGFDVVGSEARAREIAEYRTRKTREGERSLLRKAAPHLC